MRILMIATIVVLGSLNTAKSANDGTWCYRDFGATRSANCRFYSARQCLIVAGTFGGICERNNPPPPPTGRTSAGRPESSGGRAFIALEPRFPHQVADLHAVLGIINFTRFFLRGPVLRI